MLAGDADREHAVGLLKEAFAEGRLTQSEYEDRIGRAYQARTYGDLDVLTGDIPHGLPPVQAPPAFWPYPPAPPRTNGYAVGSLVCGIAGTMFGLPAVPAIVLGHIARRRIRRTGEQGDGLAVAGLVLGYVVTGLMLAVTVLLAGLVAWTAHG
ncbi:DUF1707 and DUF4190 domain-containing protein [Streptomyces sp. HPF1205]|uniref:DUF1707 and DUF4190 domain-containing protein n=1 Tax=Streptomyces sp. HPF1205 TaxID=2873262 RepID=UPI001CECDF39|nr:DUF1707 and DUF4190 domain-containing protein [Streptomyces sp. HPF1205]